ncbi:hypothetical protein HMPREF1589_03588 [Escherichia coli 113290]|nr:hypothetical protein HMPREF1589_03588 [Escherichia coli 113290]
MLYPYHRLLYVGILSSEFPTASYLTDICHFKHCHRMNITDIF